MSLLLRSALIALAVLTFTSSHAVSLSDLARHSEFYNVKISPDGKHLAVVMDQDGLRSLAFIRLKDKKPIYALQANSRAMPLNYYWISNKRVVVEVGRDIGALEQPIATGELFAVDLDGSKGRMIAGYGSQEGITTALNGYRVLDTLPEDKNYILATKQLYSRSGGGSGIPKVVKLNVYNASEREIERSPIDYGRFLTDSTGEVRFVAGMTPEGKTKLYYRDTDSEWEAFGEEMSGKIMPLAFGKDDNSIIALYAEDGEPQGLYRYTLGTNERELLYKSDIADPTYALRSALKDVYGVRLDEDYPSYHFIETDLREAQVHKALINAFNGDAVDVTSKTEDGRLIVVYVSGDRNPGTYYLVDTQKLSATYLLAARSWIKAEELGATEPFRLKTDDGLELTGYMTLPQGKQKDLPLVVMPHGGPHARDYWGYDNYTQALVSAGYAVVKVNFRGSSGYGEKFEEAGWGKWGTKIQDDITLAAKYMIQSGIADGDRVCIMGGSFGGYSALQSAIREPDLYKCAVGYVGVYDLPMLYTEGDVRQLTWGDAYLDNTLGTDVEAQIEQSPTRNIDKLKAPVFIIHGEEDQRAHIEHAYALQKALDAHNHPYEWMVKEKEGHGFYNEANIEELFRAVIKFLDKHIGE